MLDENDLKHLKRWLEKTLRPICQADPVILASYVVALLKNDKSKQEMKEFCNEQLKEFLESETNGFVEKLFRALERRSFIPEDERVKSRRTDRGRDERGRHEKDRARSRSRSRGRRSRSLSRSRSPYSRSGRDRDREREREREKEKLRSRSSKPSKDTMCPDFEQRGVCTRGSACPYSHGHERIIVKTDGRGNPPPPHFAAGPGMGRASSGGRGGGGGGGGGGGPAEESEGYDPEMPMILPRGFNMMKPNAHGAGMPPMGQMPMMPPPPPPHPPMGSGGVLPPFLPPMFNPMRPLPPNNPPFPQPSGPQHRQRVGHSRKHERPYEQDPSTRRRLRIRNIDEDLCTMAKISVFFEKFGPVAEVRVYPRNRNAVVSFTNSEDAHKALEANKGPGLMDCATAILDWDMAKQRQPGPGQEPFSGRNKGPRFTGPGDKGPGGRPDAKGSGYAGGDHSKRPAVRDQRKELLSAPVDEPSRPTPQTAEEKQRQALEEIRLKVEATKQKQKTLLGKITVAKSQNDSEKVEELRSEFNLACGQLKQLLIKQSAYLHHQQFQTKARAELLEKVKAKDQERVQAMKTQHTVAQEPRTSPQKGTPQYTPAQLRTMKEKVRLDRELELMTSGGHAYAPNTVDPYASMVRFSLASLPTHLRAANVLKGLARSKGAVRSVNIEAEGASAVVEFATPKAAQALLKEGHCVLGSHTLPLSLVSDTHPPPHSAASASSSSLGGVLRRDSDIQGPSATPSESGAVEMEDLDDDDYHQVEEVIESQGYHDEYNDDEMDPDREWEAV